MPEDQPTRLSRSVTWRVAGLWMVLFALGLAAIGVFLAIQQARTFTHRLMSQLETQAARIADKARQQFNQEVTDALSAVVEHVRGGADRPWESSSEVPRWIDGVFFGDADRAQVITPASRETQQLLLRFQEHVRSLTPLEPLERARARIRSTTVGQRPVLLAWMASTDGNERPIVVAGYVNLTRLRSDLLEPLVFADQGLELAPASAQSGAWVQPLYGPMQVWSIRPTEALLREQRSSVLGRTLVHLGLTVLSLATLLTAMWVLRNIVRRELKLAEMKANFVADVSHELKTPLSLIRLFSETLQSGRVTSEEKRQEYYAIISRESTRLTDLINNILDFSRIEAGHYVYSMEPVDIGGVVRETYEAYRAQLDHHGFEHHLTIEPSLPQIEADAGAITRALINLMNNAVKYSRDDRCLVIDVARDTRRDRRGVLISVHDRGIGITPVERARVFEGFFRASDRRVRDQGGAGLGLALVKHIVDAHDGSLEVESRLVKGSTFRIFLPESTRT